MAEVVQSLHVRVQDAVGKMAGLTDKIRAAGVNIRGIVAWTEGDEGHLIAVTDDNDQVVDAIGDDVEATDRGDLVCVKVANRIGALNEVARKLADAQIAIHMVCATTPNGGDAAILLSTADNTQAASVLG